MSTQSLLEYNADVDVRTGLIKDERIRVRHLSPWLLTVVFFTAGSSVGDLTLRLFGQ